MPRRKNNAIQLRLYYKDQETAQYCQDSLHELPVKPKKQADGYIEVLPGIPFAIEVASTSNDIYDMSTHARVEISIDGMQLSDQYLVKGSTAPWCYTQNEIRIVDGKAMACDLVFRKVKSSKIPQSPDVHTSAYRLQDASQSKTKKTPYGTTEQGQIRITITRGRMIDAIEPGPADVPRLSKAPGLLRTNQSDEDADLVRFRYTEMRAIVSTYGILTI